MRATTRGQLSKDLASIDLNLVFSLLKSFLKYKVIFNVIGSKMVINRIFNIFSS